jgi:DNA-binding response OmpR family regulator
MRNILVIDDEDSIAHLLFQMLTKYGYNVETATGGQEGIKKFVEGQFDLVITDILILGFNGNDVARPQPYQ